MTLFSKFTKSNSNEKIIYPWSQRKLSGSSAALPRFGHGAAMIDNQHLLIYGGYHKGNTKKNLFLIDTNTISAISIQTSGDVPSSRSFTAIACIDGLVLLFGGEPIVLGKIWDPQLYILYTNSKQWSKIRINGNLPRGRSGHTMSAHNGCIYVWGGQHRGQYLNEMIIFDLKEYPSKAEWQFISQTSKAPAPRAGHISAVYENKLYIFGGMNASHLYNDIWCFDFITKVWNQVEAVGYIPAPREGCAAALVNDTIYIFGGRGMNGFILGDLYAFRIKSQRWYTFQNMGSPPSPRHGASLTLIQNRMFVYGGDSANGKMDDGSFVYILDCSKIKYPPENEILENERKPQFVIALNDSKDAFQYGVVRKPSLTPKSQLRKPQYTKTSDLSSSLENHSYRSPSTSFSETHSYKSKSSHAKGSEPLTKTPPPRPPREGVTLNAFKKPSTLDLEEKSRLLRDILARDTVITEMRKKEQWWRTEVSIARHARARLGDLFDDDGQTQDANLFDFREGEHDKLLLFKQLASAKAEIRKMKSSIEKQTDSMIQDLLKQETIRATALKEAAYYKSKYKALKSKDKTAVALLETERVEVLENRLKEARIQKDQINIMLLEVQKRSQEDQRSRQLAEERASIAQQQSEMAQEAHQATLEKISKIYSQILKTEAKCREDVAKIASLSNKLVNQLSSEEDNMDLSEIHIQKARLEAVNIKSRNEIVILLQQLEKHQDEKDDLESLLDEKNQAYAETLLELEKVRIELELLRRSTKKKNVSGSK
ncbi:hypothetical protein G6F43_010318 [Rhizopus delemar]|nr:hypothetical protein G6F43_010318 [Rhizopus delemar]